MRIRLVFMLYAYCWCMLLGCLIFPHPLENNPWPILGECTYYIAVGVLLSNVYYKLLNLGVKYKNF